MVGKVRIKMNYTQKQKLIDRLCGVGLMLIFAELMLQVVHSSYTEFNFNLRDVSTKVYIGGGILLAVSIALLIYAYIKQSGSKACYGLELMVLSITLAVLPGCYLYFAYPFNELRRVFPFLFLVYYIGKIVYLVKHRNDVVNSRKNNSKKKKR